jgi:hypothetical protein
MEHAPSHAAIIRTEAMADGVNPYSGEPRLAYSDAPIPVDPAAAYANPAGHSRPDAYVSMNGQPLYTTGPAVTETRKGVAHDQSAATSHGFTQSVSGQQQSIPKRPAGARTDSTPHVPGEYPRATPLQSPSV